MDDRPVSRLQRRVSLFRWLIPFLVLSLALIHLILELSPVIEPAYWEPLDRITSYNVCYTKLLRLIHLILELSPVIEPAYWEPLELLILLAGVSSSWWILSYLRGRIKENEAADIALRQAYKDLNKANERQIATQHGSDIDRPTQRHIPDSLDGTCGFEDSCGR